MTILVLEASTTSAKALVQPGAGLPSVETRVLSASGAAGVRDAGAVTDEVIAVARELLARTGLGLSVEAIALSSTWHCLLLVRGDGTAASSAYEWPWRGAAELSALRREDAAATAEFYRRTGCMVSAVYPAFKLEKLRADGEVVDGTYVGDQGSHLFAALTGERGTTWAAASGSGLRDVRTGEPADEVLGRASVDADRLIGLRAPSDTAPLGADAARRLGVRSGIPVLPALPDGALGQVGDGTGGPDVMTLSMGTSAALRVAVDRPVLDPAARTWCYRGVDGWLSGAATSGCTNCVDWAKARLFPGLDFAAIDAALAGTPRWAPGPVFLPYLVGERSPGWQDARTASWTDVTYEHDGLDLYRAVLQGVLHTVTQCYRALVSLHGAPARVRLSGGVLSSPTWTQMVADALGRPVEIAAEPHSSLVGGARVAASVLGRAVPMPQESTAATVEPDGLGVAAAAELFERFVDRYESGVAA